jgi:hypothetical protein
MQDGVSVKGGGIRGEKGVERGWIFHFTRGRKDFGGSLEYWTECNLQWNLQCTGGLRRFWARRARISIDILGLGTTSRQGGWFWGGVLRSKLKEQTKEALRKQAATSGSG